MGVPLAGTALLKIRERDNPFLFFFTAITRTNLRKINWRKYTHAAYLLMHHVLGTPRISRGTSVTARSSYAYVLMHEITFVDRDRCLHAARGRVALINFRFRLPRHGEYHGRHRVYCPCPQTPFGAARRCISMKDAFFVAFPSRRYRACTLIRPSYKAQHSIP